MRKGVWFVVFTAFGVFAGCGSGTGNRVVDTPQADAETTARIEKAVAAAPTRGMLVGLETQAFEAWKSGDAAFWESYLDPAFVSFAGGKRVDKAGQIKFLTSGKCEIASYSLSDEKMTPVGNDAIMLTVKASMEGKCGDDKGLRR